MYKVGDYIVYKKDVCIIKDVKLNSFNNEYYYSLLPINDKSLKIDIPVSDKLNNIRDLISKKEIENIIKQIPNIPIIESDDKYIESEYKKLLSSNNHFNLIRIIKTTYLRNKDRIDNKKKISDKDNSYFNLAEKYLYNEFSIVLGLSFDDTKKYIMDNVTALKN